MTKNNQVTFDPFDDRYYEIEKNHKAELAQIESETDWLEVFPEAKAYIAQKSVEIGKQITQLKKSWSNHSKQISTESKGNELEVRLLLIDAFYSLEINRLAEQLKIFAKETNKHLRKAGVTKNQDQQNHYTQDDIENARHFPLVELFEMEGNVLKRSGRNFMTLCPFHDENTPSCCIYPDDNYFHCFGCQAHGNPIDYLMKKNHLSFMEAMEAIVG